MRRALWILLRWPFRKWLHRRCLRRIAALVPATQHVQINSNPYALTNPTEGDKHVA